MLSPTEEDAIAKILTSLTPLEYSQLMKKVDRRKWDIIGFKYSPRDAKPRQK